jgi:hypothetical protein
MNATPDTDIRAALADASDVAGLTFSTEAVLSEGHRVVRRRRAAATGLVAAATAVIAVVAVRLGTDQPRALPALPPSATQITAPVATGPLTGTTSSDGIRDGLGVDVTVTPGSDGRVRETWTLYDGATVRRTITRLAAASGAGQVSFLMPVESGQKGVVYGYALTGPEDEQDVHVLTRVVTAPSTEPGSGTLAALRDVRTRRVVGSVFVWEIRGVHAETVIGVTWSREKVTPLAGTSLGEGAALRLGRAGGVTATVVTLSPRTSVMLWRDPSGRTFGVPGGPVETDPGDLQVAVAPRTGTGPGRENDLAVGWVSSGLVELTSTDPADAFTITYGKPEGGRTPFVARATNPYVRGTVTVTGGGETQTLAGWGPPTP